MIMKLTRRAYAIPSLENLTSSVLVSHTPSAASSSCRRSITGDRIYSLESEPALSPGLLNARLEVRNALAVEPLQVDRMKLFLAPGLVWLGEQLQWRRDLKSGWRAGTEAAMAPMFCSRLEFAAGSGLVVWIFR